MIIPGAPDALNVPRSPNGLGGFGGHAWTVMEFRCCNDADLDPKEQNLTTNSA